MFSKKIAFALLITAALVFGSLTHTKTAPQVSASENLVAPTAADAPKYALLIGINKYKIVPKNKVRDLNGTNNDVALMKDLLVDIYGFKYEKDSPNSPVKYLLNSDATQQGIRDAFKSHIIENAKKYKETAKVEAKDGATVVFYYSGHGSQLEDDNGDESDGIDETIMPHDTTTDRVNQKDIRDDEFDVWFNELRKYTTNITFIFDSCHSGTMTRGGNNKSVKRDLEIKSTSRSGDAAQVRDGMIKDSSAGGEVSKNESFVAISGSLPHQESQEDKFVDPNTKEPRWSGALTYSMVHLLRQNPDITYREMIKLVQDKVVSMQKNQTPQAEGDLDRKIFGSAQTRGKTPIFIEKSELVTRKNGDQDEEVFEISMKAGSIVGMGTGAAVAVFAKKDGVKVREQIGSGMVVSSTEFDSKAEIALDDKTIKKMPKDAVVNLVSPNFTNNEGHLVAFDYPEAKSKSGGAGAAASLTSKVFDYVRSKLDTKKIVKTVESSSVFKRYFGSKGAESPEWQFAVIHGTFGEFKYQNPTSDLLKSSKSGSEEGCSQTKPDTDEAMGYFIVNRDGMPVYNLWFNESENEEVVGNCLSNAITKIARIENLRTLKSGESDLNEKFKVELVRLNKFNVVSQSPLKCESEPVSPEQQAKDQTEIPQMKADDKYYLKVTNESSQNLNVYIYSLTTNGKITMLFPPKGAAEGEKLLAGKSYTTLEKLAPGNCGAFMILPPDVEPPGLETIKVIASAKNFPGEMLEQDDIAPKNTRGGALNAIIEQAVAGGASRSGAMKFDVSDWTTKEIHIQIVR